MAEPTEQPAPDTIETDNLNDGDALTAWLSSADADTYTVSVYRIDQKARQKQALVDTWYNSCPTPSDIGEYYGPGEYRLLITVKAEGKKPSIKAIRINIAPDFGARKNSSSPAAAPIAAAPAPAASGISESLSLMREMLSMFMPLLVAQRQSAPDLSGLMVEQYKTMQGVLSNNLTENVKLYRSLAEKAAETMEQETHYDDDEPAPAGAGFLDSIRPLIEQYLPLILGDKTGAMAAAAKALPAVSDALGDPKKVQSILGYVSRKYGKADAEKLKKTFGL